MGIYIPNEKMPDCCENCFISNCGADIGYLYSGRRSRNCPLIEVPKHGDLIDRDRLTDTIDGITWYHQNKNKDMVEGANSAEHQAWYREQDVHEDVADAPIVVESEET